MKRSVLFGALLALVVVSLAFAQGKPNFSGKWTPEQAAAGGGGRGMAGPMTVTQDDKTLTVERSMGGNTMKAVYNLDGSESKNSMMGRGGETMEQVSTAKWDGSKLAITTKTANGESTQTWSLSSDGKLQIERQGRQGPVTTTYTKG